MRGTVSIFISSTFRDMHAERDCLVKRVFPRLQAWLEPHQLALRGVDLRWGITREEAENGRVLDLCLQHIDRCRPFFIGLLGQRYGWVPDSSSGPQTDPSCANGRSITEMEILHGVLEAKAQRPRALFCFRTPESLASIPEALRADYEEQAPELERRLSNLKRRIREDGFTIIEYSPKWDGCKRIQGLPSLGGLGHLGDFENAVHDWLRQAISVELALPENAKAVAVDPWLRIQGLLESRLDGYVSRPNVERELQLYLNGPSHVPLLVHGPPGIGKSTMLAWLATHLPDGTRVVPFLVGTGPGTEHLSQLLRWWCQ